MMNKKSCDEVYKIQKKEKIKLGIIQASILIILFALWEVLAHFEILDQFLFSRPSAIFKLFKEYLLNNELFPHIFISVYETVLGIVIGTVGGVLIASILWWSEKLAKILDPFFIVLNALPKTALAPIMIIWAGTGISGIVVVAISILVLVTIISTYNHFTNIEEEKVKMMKSFKATKFQIFTKYVLPSNIGNLLNVIKINIGMAWVGVIVGEFLVSQKGIGHLLMYGGQIFRFDMVMMWVIVLALCALIMYGIVNLIEKFVIKGRIKEK